MSSANRYLRAAVAIACLVCGFIITISPHLMARTICRVIGAIALTAGIVELSDNSHRRSITNRTVGAIILIAVSALLIFAPGFVLRSTSLVSGLTIIALCLRALFTSLESRADSSRHWYLGLAFSICGMVLGLILVIGGRYMTAFMIRIIGIALLVGGIRMTISAFSEC